MSNRPTPETDAVAEGVDQSNFEDSWRDDFKEFAWVPAEFARKLERERDEAREEWGKASMDAAQLLSEKTKVMAERDEALEELEEYRSIAENIGAEKAISEKERAIRERDELQMAVNGLCLHFGVRPANTTLLAVEVLRIQREREEAITRRMETIMQCELYEQERDEAREENEKLREALLRVRTWGIESKNFSSNDNGKMAHWIDEGCTGELPEPDGPWIYERMEENAKLRRERDEAREAFEHVKEYGTEEINAAIELRQKLAQTLIERDEAREALREIWQSGDAFLPYIDQETTNRWRRVAGLEEIK